MNNKYSQLKVKFTRGNGLKNLVISIVILVEILAIMGVATFAWVETVSSIKIYGDGIIDTYVYTDAEIGSGTKVIDMADYFKQSGDMHLAPASSANGTTFYFPQVASTAAYRKGNISDKNTAYLSVSFRVKTDTNADFFFTKVPTFSANGANIRVSVTSQSEGSDEAPVTKIYALTNSSASVVNSTTGGTSTATVEAFANHIKGKSSSARLFSVAADETKIVTVNLWLQKTGTDMNSVMSQNITITDLGIISDLTPRRVTLIPTSTWEPSKVTTHFYAWCFEASNGDADRLYKLTEDENEHYSFEYNGTYQKTVFLRSGNANLTTDNIGNWSDVWNQTVNTTIPASPVDPTYIITSMSGGTDGKSTGDWIEPATIKLAYVDGQNSSCGTLNATSYIGTGTTTTVLETTDSNKTVHRDTVHARTGKTIQLTVSSNGGYQFVGWYTDASGSTLASSNAAFTTTAPATATEITYYAKFKPVSTVTLHRYLDGNASTTGGTIQIDSTTGSTSYSSVSKTVDRGASVKLYASPSSGYTLSGIYTTITGGTQITNNSYVTVDSDVNYYARFTTNSYNVTAHSRYSTNGGTSFSTSDSTTGGTVKVGSSSASSSSTASVKYNSTVTLTASANSGYTFVGWYNGTSTTATQLSTNASYSYTLTTAGAVSVYARFVKASDTIIYVAPRENWGDNYYIRLYDEGGHNISTTTTNGFVKAEYDGSTGYYKATFSSGTTGTFYAILAKDSNYTGQVPSSGGRSGTLGNSYIFNTASSGALTTYTNQRCIWFIIGSGVSWIKDNINNYGDYMNIWANSTDNRMRRINDNAYVYEFASVSGTIYFQQHYSGSGNRNQWTATIQSNKSQFTASTYNSGSWTG